MNESCRTQELIVDAETPASSILERRAAEHLQLSWALGFRV